MGAGPPVVVLHGGPGAHHDYLLPQFDRLSEGRRLHYYDQRGGGRSGVSRDIAVGATEHVADLDALIAAWGIAPATILGYSWGGLLALLFAVRHPEHVGRLALVAPAPASATGRNRFEANFAERMRAPEITNAREELRASDLRERDPDGYARRAFELSVAGYFRTMANAKHLTPFRLTGRTQQAVWASLGDYDIRPRVSELNVPARVFHGRHDPIPLEESTATAGLLGAELVVFEDSGHCPYVEEPDRFVAELGAWLPEA